MMIRARTVIRLAILIEFTCAHLHIRLEDDHCPLSARLRHLIDEFFEHTTYIKFTVIVDNRNESTLFPNDIVHNFLSTTTSLIENHVVDFTEEESYTPVSSMYKRYGTRYSESEEPTNHATIRQMRKVQQRKNVKKVNHFERQLGVFVLVKSLQTLKRYLAGPPRHPFLQHYAHYVIVVSTSIDYDYYDGQLSANILHVLWNDYRIMHAIVIHSCWTRELVGYYDPFEPGPNVSTQPNWQDSWGALIWTEITDEDFTGGWSHPSELNFRGYPIIASVFERYPTFIRLDELPPLFVNSFVAAALRTHGDGYGGFDAMLMANLAQAMNFRAVTYISESFGVIHPNKTSTGSLGDVLYEKADISFSSRFVEMYGSNSLNFILPIVSDKMCFVVPSARQIPGFSVILYTFELAVWLNIAAMYTICIICVVYVRKTSMTLQHRRPPAIDKQKVALDLFFMLTASPTKMPRLAAERWIIGFCLIAAIPIIGTFQGVMMKAFSSTFYEDEIDTLAELDESGLPIRASSMAVPNLFGSVENALIDSLRSKFVITNNTFVSTIQSAASGIQVCGMERLSDAFLIIKKYHTNELGRELVHVVSECIREYHLGFIVKRGSPYTGPFIRILTRFQESGFHEIWSRHIREALTPRRSQQLHTQLGGRESVAFSINDVQVAFFVLVVGQMVAILTFGAEVFYVSFTG